jgi:iron(III) transport system ATP-binding protein
VPAIKRDYGIVFQSYALFPELTVHDNVAYGLVNRASAARPSPRVRELLTLVGLPMRVQVSRAALGRAAAAHRACARARTSPGLLLLDEPLSALDAIERVRLRGEIRALAAALGVTTIMVTHDQEEALSMADRIVVMNAGRIEQVGTPRESTRRPPRRSSPTSSGKINVLPPSRKAGGRFRVGALSLAVSGDDLRRDAGQAVLASRGRRRARQRRGAASARGRRRSRIEFLGAFCHGRSRSIHGALPVVANVPRQAVDSARSHRASPSREPARARCACSS